MRQLLFALILTVVIPAWAQTVKLSCNSSTSTALKDTSYILTETSDGYRLRVEFAPGAMPLDADPTTTTRPRDLQVLAEREELFGRLPNAFSLDFKKEECLLKNQNSHIDWHCLIRTPGHIENFPYEAVSFFATSRKVESMDGSAYWYYVGFDFKLTHKQVLGEEAFNRLMQESRPSEQRALVFRQNHEYLVKTTTLIYENTDGFKSCYIPEHPPLTKVPSLDQ